MLKRPLVLLDIDGPLNPFLSFRLQEDGYERVQGGYAMWMLHRKHGDWIRALLVHADAMWATSWQDVANEVAAPFYGLPALPVIHFTQPSANDTRQFKLREVLEVSEGRPFVWIDDEIEDESLARVQSRGTSALIVRPHPSEGWTQAQFNQCAEFVAGAHSIPGHGTKEAR